MKILFLSVFLLILSFSSFKIVKAQSNCANADFSMGDFTNWQGYYGDFDNPTRYSGFVTTGYSRHLIMNNPEEKDHNACDQLSTVPPGQFYSARLGNDNVGAQAEQLRYSIDVTPENTLFIYQYAVVLQEPNHNPSQQPSFTVEVLDKEGRVFDSNCGYYYVYAKPDLEGWHTCNGNYSRNVIWKDWTTVGLNLAPLIGQRITIVFTTRDCNLGGHFGYAYISTSCSKLQMSVSYCPGSSKAVLSAPPGFSYLWSNGATTQSIEVTDPVEGVPFDCLLTAVNGCQVPIGVNLHPTSLEPDFVFTSSCQGNGIILSDQSTVNQNIVHDWTWDFGDGTEVISGNNTVLHTYDHPGDYTVKLTASSTDNCSASISKPVNVDFHPQANLSGPEVICAQAVPAVYSTDPLMEDYLWTVSSGGEILSGTGTNEIKVKWTKTGAQQVSVSYTKETNCSGMTKNVMVNPNRVPLIIGSTNVCEGTTDLIYRTEEAMTGYTWTISPGGSLKSETNSIKVDWNSSGPQRITVQYTDPNGCLSAPANLTVNVNPRPIPGIQGSDYSCEGAGNVIYTTEPNMHNYSWTTSPGGTVITGAQNDILKVEWKNSGQQFITVNYQNSYGCTALSPTVRNISIIPKPELTITGKSEVCQGSADLSYWSESYEGKYEWTISSGGNIRGENDHSVKVSWNDSGLQTIAVRCNDKNGCSFGAKKDVLVNPFPVPTIKGLFSVCEGASGINYSTQDSMTNYKWNISPGGVIENGKDSSMINVNWMNAGLQNVSINYTDSKGCTAPLPSSELIQVNSLPAPSISGKDTIWVGKIYSYLTESNMTDYSWSTDPQLHLFGENHSDSVSIKGFEPGDQNLYVTYSDKNGCQPLFPSVKIVHVVYPPISIIEAFSPNDDGLNDRLVFKGLENYPSSELYIYTKAGQLIYYNSDYQNNWDGKVFIEAMKNNVPAVRGVYYYVLKLGGTERKIKGFIYLGY